MFVDRAEIEVRGGVGGSGAEAFRRESGVPMGGPSGGDGGKGGDVVVEVDPQLSTLLDYRYRRQYHAERGQHGEGSNRTGKSGEDLILRIPAGTTIVDADTEQVLGELLAAGERLVVARGGRGGRGNARFASSTNQAPRRWEPGGEGQERRVRLELKLIADVGLVGEPNAGKSTLLSSVTSARPKVADYPFTTLSPNLGVVQLPGFRTFVIADIPGIIEGAHDGKGLGHLFLRHIERTRTLALLVPVDAAYPQLEHDTLRAELAAYSAELALRPYCVVLTKADLLGPDVGPPVVEAPDAWGRFVVSSIAHQGLGELLEALWEKSREREQVEKGEGEKREGEEDWWTE